MCVENILIIRPLLLTGNNKLYEYVSRRSIIQSDLTNSCECNVTWNDIINVNKYGNSSL